MGYRLAVDVGGRFTDAVLTDHGGKRLVAIKVPTTPANRADGVRSPVRRYVGRNTCSPMYLRPPDIRPPRAVRRRPTLG
jgi:N-methylhydantoinase A/oxoprolinase/acetone carboxylase beta subunit